MMPPWLIPVVIIAGGVAFAWKRGFFGPKDGGKEGGAFVATPAEPAPRGARIGGKRAQSEWKLLIREEAEAALEDCSSQGMNGLSDLKRCGASRMFPASIWPPPPNAATWQVDAWNEIDDQVRKYLNMDPGVG